MAIDYTRVSDSLSKESLKHALKTNYIKGAIVLALLGGGTLGYHAIKEKHKGDIESVINDDYPFPKQDLRYRDEPDFKANGKEKLKDGITIIRDNWLNFYVVQDDDIKREIYYENKTIYETVRHGKKKSKVSKIIKIEKYKNILDIKGIREKLSKIPEFKYLENSEYEIKVKGFNIPKDIVDKEKLGYIKEGKFYIPIPLDSKKREISPENFANYCYDAIKEMKSDHKYGEEFQEMVKAVSEKELIAIMLAFARSESTGEYTAFTEKIGAAELHRREDHLDAFSFTYFHILMEKNSDGIPGPGLKARQELGFSEGECYHPKNAAKLFLGYYINKKHSLDISRKNKGLSPYKRSDLFPITDANIPKVAKIYNGSTSYADKLMTNYHFAKKLINGEIKEYANTKLESLGFEYKGLNTKAKHIYKYKVPEAMPIETMKAEIVKKFNENKDSKIKDISESDICRSDGTTISDKLYLNAGDPLYVMVN